MKEWIASFPHSNFAKYYFFSLFFWIILCAGAVGIVIYLDRYKIFVQKDRNYMYEFFASRPKAARILFSMFGLALIMFIGLFTLVSLSKRYS